MKKKLKIKKNMIYLRKNLTNFDGKIGKILTWTILEAKTM